MTARRLAWIALLLACGASEAAGPRRPEVVIDGRVRFSVEIVDTPQTRTRGLSGHAPLGELEGMLFLFDAPSVQSFWMKDMLFDIDILWIRDGKLIGWVADAKRPVPGQMLPIYRSPSACEWVLELPAGSARRFALAIGDSVRVEGGAAP
jgi:uncharacterized membrane protein (UPF0127 family)